MIAGCMRFILSKKITENYSSFMIHQSEKKKSVERHGSHKKVKPLGSLKDLKIKSLLLNFHKRACTVCKLLT